MFELVTKSSEILGKRFVSDAFLPAVAFCLALVAALAAPSGGDRLRAWDGQPGAVKAAQALALVFLALLIAIALASSTSGLLRLYEGYWPGAGVPAYLAEHGRRYHRRRLRALAQAGDDQTIYGSYPPPTRLDEVVPTRLGNVLKSAELYPSLRYGMDAVLFWPRLFPVLPDRLSGLLVASRGDCERALAISVLSAGFAIVAGGRLLVTGASAGLYLACVWGGSAVAVVAYRTAIASLAAHAEYIRSAFDLYRRALVPVVDGEAATISGDERAYWQRMGQFWYRGVPRTSDIALAAAPGEAAGNEETRWSLTSCYAAVMTVLGLVGAALLVLVR